MMNIYVNVNFVSLYHFIGLFNPAGYFGVRRECLGVSHEFRV